VGALALWDWRGTVTPRTADEFERKAKWWEDEANWRGTIANPDSRWYALNMRLAALRRHRDHRAQPWTPGYDVPAPRCERLGTQERPKDCGPEHPWHRMRAPWKEGPRAVEEAELSRALGAGPREWDSIANARPLAEVLGIIDQAEAEAQRKAREAALGLDLAQSESERERLRAAVDLAQRHLNYLNSERQRVKRAAGVTP
jgi:hypothetical protein